ncbi:hypothetical protein [Neoaquamicrobium sediminum]|uniref:hypothetical protein n=1 Tax=Neoaquamicrobium sediminum TaxID=1849104 RepID=UPI0040367ACE
MAAMVAMFEERKLKFNDRRVKVAKLPAADPVVGTAAPAAAAAARDEANRRSEEAVGRDGVEEVPAGSSVVIKITIDPT